MRTLELYCGCGGLSFADRHGDEVVIKTMWAVDYEESMIRTFLANYPYAHVSSFLSGGCCNNQPPGFASSWYQELGDSGCI